MAIPNNVLQQVTTYQDAGLAYLQNSSAFIATANKKFLNFQNECGNLGQSVSFSVPPRLLAKDSLVVTFQAATQNVETLTVDQEASVALAFTVQQFIYNVRDYMEQWGKTAIMELGAKIEANIAEDAVNNTYRFYGDGSTAINSLSQLAKMLARYRNVGGPKNKLRVYLPDVMVPDIVNSMMNQFTPIRNDRAANSWELGNWQGVEFYTSNLLPIHNAGNVGEDNLTLTVISTNDPTGANVTQITLSGAANSDAAAIKANDLLQFSDNVSGRSNVRFLTFYGHNVSDQPVQVRATSDAASDGSGHVTITIDPPLSSSIGGGMNINTPIVAGMQMTALPSHRAGLVVGGDALFLAMPRLPEETPYPTANKMDPSTGAAVRMYYGSRFGMNERGIIHDQIWGSKLVPEYGMRIAFPIA